MKLKLFFVALFLSFGFYLHAQTYLMNAASNNTNVTTCSGTLYDDGGTAGNYTMGQVYVITLTPATAGTRVQLTFTQWGVDNTTQLEMFDGPTTSSSSLGTFGNSISPMGIQIMASATNLTGQLTLRWTGGSTAAPGFAATIGCHIPCQTIYAHIDSIACIPDMVNGYIDVCVGTPITFSAFGEYTQNNVVYSQSDATSTFLWDFGDGTTGTGQTVTHTYPYASGFDFSVSITDSMGCGTSNYEAGRVRHSDNPISSINPVPDMCTDDTVNILTGFSAVSTIVIENVNGGASGELELADTTFLPDGTGTSYTSNLNYTVFPAGMTLSNINDLLGVCLNMEHTYMGDLQISLICPNGNSTVLLSYSGNTGGGTILGEPVGQDLPVDANTSNTTPGIGYDYCFSPTATSGFIDNSSNWTTLTSYTDPIGQVSSNIKQANAGTYQADGIWTNLIGCPLNGIWKIQVTDNLAADNGYIFSWGLSLNPALIPGGWQYTVPIDSVTWAGPNISATSDSTANIIPDSSGLFVYTATVWDSYGCSYDTSFNVQVVKTPDVNLGPDTTLCGNGIIYSLDAGPGEHFLWSTSSHAQIIPVDISGVYAVSVTNNNAANTLSCSNTDTVNVKILALPSADLGTDFCSNVPVTLDAGNPGFNYIWSTSPSDTNQTLYVDQAGTYSVTVYEELGYNCESVSDVNFSYFPIPDISIGPDSTICRHHTINIDVTDTYGYLNDNNYSYMWYPYAKTDPYLTLTWLDPTTYTIIVEVTGCPSDVVRDTMILTVEPCDLVIPNVFTPNGDGINDRFNIPNVEYYPNSTMQIYNRWGRKVFESSSYMGDWDGGDCAAGVYYYVFTANLGNRGNGDELKPQNGTVTILR